MMAAAIALLIGRGRGPDGRPWLWAALLSTLGAIGFATVGGTAAWRDFYAAMADVPTVPIMFAAGAFGALVAWAGWNAGKRRTPSRALLA